MKLRNIELSRNVSILLLFLVFCFLLSSSAEEPLKFFVKEPEAEVLKDLISYQTALRNKEYGTAAIVFAKLAEHEGVMHKIADGRFVSMYCYLKNTFQAEGVEALKDFRGVLDPEVKQLLKTYEETSDVSILRTIIRCYPFSSHHSLALIYLAFEEADKLNFCEALYCFNQVALKSQELLVDKGIATLYVKVVLACGNAEDIDIFAGVVENLKLTGMEFDGKPLSEVLRKRIEEDCSYEETSWNYRYGAATGVRVKDCTVRQPSLVWHSPVSAKEEENELKFKYWNVNFKTEKGRDGCFFNYPVIQKNKIFTCRNGELRLIDIAFGKSKIPVAGSAFFGTARRRKSVFYFSSMAGIKGKLIFNTSFPEFPKSYLADIDNLGDGIGELQEIVHEAGRFKGKTEGEAGVAAPLPLDGKLFTLGCVKKNHREFFLTKRDIKSGKKEWSSRVFTAFIVNNYVEDSNHAAPVIGNGTVFMATDQTIAAVDSHTGSTLWVASSPFPGYMNKVPAHLHCVEDKNQLIIVRQEAAICSLDMRTGEKLWFYDWQDTQYLGIANGKMYAFGDESFWSIDLNTSEDEKLFGLNSREFCGGCVTSEKMYYVFDGKLYVHSLADFKRVSVIEVLGLSPGMSVHIIPFGDKLFVFSNEDVWCFSDRSLLDAMFAEKLAKDPESASIHYQLGLINSENLKIREALVNFDNAAKFIKPAEEYEGYLLETLLEEAICHCYMSLLKDAEEVEISPLVDEALKKLKRPKSKAAVCQFKLMLFVRNNQKQELVEYFLTELPWEGCREIYVHKNWHDIPKLPKSLWWNQDIMRLSEFLSNLLDFYQYDLNATRVFEEYATAEGEKLLKGEPANIPRLGDMLSFTTAHKRVIRTLSLMVLDGIATKYQQEALLKFKRSVLVGDVPEFHLAYASLVRAEKPTLADAVIADIFEHYSSLTLENEKTIADYAPTLIPNRLEKQVIEETEVTGYTQMFAKIEIPRMEANKANDVAMGSNGLVVLTDYGTALACYNVKTEKIAWKTYFSVPFEFGFNVNLDEMGRIFIKEILKDSVAEKSGLQGGDELLSAKTRDGTVKPEDILHVLKYPRAIEYELTFDRDGTAFTVKIIPQRNTRAEGWLCANTHLFALCDDSVLVIRRNYDRERIHLLRYNMSDGKEISCVELPYYSCFEPQLFNGRTLVISSSIPGKIVNRFIDAITIETTETIFKGQCVMPLAVDSGMAYFQVNDDKELVCLDLLNNRIVSRFDFRNRRFFGRVHSHFLLSFPSLRIRKADVLDLHTGRFFTISGKDLLFYGKYFCRVEDEISVCELEAPFRNPIKLNIENFEPNEFFYDDDYFYFLGTVSADSGSLSVIRKFNSDFTKERFLKIDRKTNKVVLSRWIPRYGEQTRFEVLDGAFYFSSKKEQATVWIGVLVDTASGEVLFENKIDKSIPAPRFFGNLLLVSGFNEYRIYRKISYGQQRFLRRELAERLKNNRYSFEECMQLERQLNLAHMMPEVVKIIDFMVERLDEDVREFDKRKLFEDRNIACAKLAEQKKYKVAQLSSFEADGKTNEWSEDGWIDFPANAATLPESRAELPGKGDVEPRFQLGIFEDQLCVSVEVKDNDFDLLRDSSEMLRIFVGKVDETLKISLNPLIVDLRLEKDGRKSLRATQTKERNETDFRVLLCHSGISRNDEERKIVYEFSVPLFNFKDSPGRKISAEEVTPLISRLSFNLGVVDSDAISTGVRYLDLAPSLFVTRDARGYAEELFPRFYLEEAK